MPSSSKIEQACNCQGAEEGESRVIVASDGTERLNDKELVEPLFGEIKEVRGFRRFSLRGVSNVTTEWVLICPTHNLMKLFRNKWVPQGV